MKKINLLFLMLGLVSLTFLSSCGTDEDENLNPILTISPSSAQQLVEGEEFSVEVVAGENPTSKKRLETLTITSDAGANESITIQASTYTNTFVFTVPPARSAAYTFTFTVTDRDGLTATRTLSVTSIVEPPVGTPFGAEVVGAFFHIQGTLHGAYDLVNETTVAAAGAESIKDMKNTDAAGVTFTGSWTTGTGNTTAYRKVNTFDYDNGTVEDAITAYNAGTASTNVNNPATGDIYIAKIRGGNDYAVIKITNVDANDNTCNCGNRGKISFNYKKS
jgi:hypothetical protein